LGALRLGRHVLKTPAVCGAVLAKNIRVMSSAVSRALEQGADLVELRVDGLQNQEGWKRLLRGGFPMILTNRPRREGGVFLGSEEKRVKTILEAIEGNVPCVDIEFSTPEKLRNRVVSAANRAGVSVLMSSHDLSVTPAVKVLREQVKKMAEAGCDLAKVVTFAQNPSDSMRVLDFLVEVQDEVSVPVIAFAMGDAGKITRIASLLLGSPITYASVGRTTAPGQLGVAETKQLLRRLMPKGD